MIKTTQLLTADLILVEVPKDAIKVKVKNNVAQTESLCIEVYNSESTFSVIQIEQKGVFELLGEVTADEITFDIDELGYDWESFYSLLQSNGLYFVNPIGGKPRWDQESPSEYPHDFYDHLEKWQEAESKVIKGKLVILKPTL